MNGAIIRTESLTRRLAGEVPVTLVDDVSISIDEGILTVITGPSGSGKSSLLYLLGLLDEPSSGRILIEGKDVSASSEEQLAGIRLSKIGFVFQFHFLLPELTALENVMLPMQKLAARGAEEMRTRAETLLSDLGLASQIHKLPKQLSGGQSQRVAIARALANDPKIILADEPTGNLDTASSSNVESILRDLAHRRGRAVVIVTHEQRIAKAADRLVTIVDGKVAAG